MSNDWMIWIGRTMSGLVIVFLLGASVAPKLLGVRVATDTLAGLGWHPQHVLVVGIIELACILLYAIPRTSLVGALLTTALLGGAIALNWRAGQPLFSHVLFGVYLGLVMWAGLWLRDPALRALVPLRAG